MRKRVWHKGPPPHVGWWNASVCCDPDSWRWWDGKEWSWSYSSHGEDSFTGRLHESVNNKKYIEWTYYYPKNARVPRVKP